MTAVEQLQETWSGLGLAAVEARLEGLLEQAAKKEPSYGDFLLEVLTTESDARRQRYLKTRLQLAHLPYLKTFDQCDFGFQPSIDGTADSGVAHAALRPRSEQRDLAWAAGRGQDALGRSVGGGGYPRRPGGVLHDGARPGG